MPKSIVEPQRETPVFREYDVVVLGGGPAGITAAVAASRDGASTLLVERYGFWVEWARPRALPTFVACTPMCAGISTGSSVA